VALDCALDFPWRSASGVHRVVIMLTDEPLEGGNQVAESLNLAGAVVKKIHGLKVMLNLVAPESDGFEIISAADKAEWSRVEGGDGLSGVNFSKVLSFIAKSITKSQSPLGAPPPSIPRALFGQDRWS
jgi:hypothetical protein